MKLMPHKTLVKTSIRKDNIGSGGMRAYLIGFNIVKPLRVASVFHLIWHQVVLLCGFKILG